MKVVRTILISVALTLSVAAPVGASGNKHRVNPRPWYYAIEEAGPYIFHKFGCMIGHESTSTYAHPNLGDNNRWGSSGVFQIIDSTWLAHSGFHFHVWQASLREQAIGALHIERVDGFGPWTTSVLC